MTKHTHQTETHYSPATREVILNRLLTALQTDNSLKWIREKWKPSLCVRNSSAPLEAIEFPRVFR